MNNDLKIIETKKSFKILIVDDVPQNIQVLAGILQKAGYQLGFAKDGKTALAHVESTQFDLILLDIMMPELDGFEVCARLKKDKRKKDIPVIFITAKNAPEDKTKGFELGAVDYISKPFDTKEVLARVKTHLTIYNYATKLEQMVEERTRQLLHADRLATLGTFSAAMVHEINNPLSFILGNARLLKLFWESAKPIIERHADEDKTGKTAKCMEDVDKWFTHLLKGGYRIYRLANSLRSYSRKTDTRKEQFQLIECINDALNLVSHKFKFSNVAVELEVCSSLMVYADQQKLSQVFVNLFNNACEAMGREEEGKVIVTASLVNEQIHITVKDNGPGISKEIGDKIFLPFFTTKDKDKGTGLGLFIVRTIIEENQGKISLSACSGEGAEFKISLPSG